jgi:hypothetical protein
MSRQGEGVLVSLGTIGALWFLGYCVRCWILGDKVGEGLFAAARGCLCKLRMKVVGHGDGS